MSTVDCPRPHRTSISRWFSSSMVWILSGIHDAAWQPRSRSQLDWDPNCLKATSLEKWSPVFLNAGLQQHRCSASCAMNVACRYQSSVRPQCPSHAISWTNNPIPSVPVLVRKFLNKPEARCIKLRSRKSAPAHPRARIHSYATLRPRERPRGSTPVGAAHVVRPWLIKFRVNL